MRDARGDTAPPEVDERTVRLTRRRFVRRQWARRLLTLRPLIALVLLGAAGIAAAWVVLFSSWLAVEEVAVEGTDLLAPGAVRAAAAVPTGEPLARVDLDSVRSRVENLPEVASVDVSRSWPEQVRISVVERQAVAVVQRDGLVQGMDAEGVLFRRYPRPPQSLPLVRIRADTQTEALAEAARVVEALPDLLDGRVDHVVVATVDDITLRLRDGRSIVWGSAEESASKGEVLAVLLRREAAVYDVSVPGQPTTRG